MSDKQHYSLYHALNAHQYKTQRGIVWLFSIRMDQIRDGWFSELNDLWPGQCMSLKVEKLLYDAQSKYQHIQVLQTSHHGKALILDGIIQCTERDEFAYQEMISFLPLCAHSNPRSVLIVGGGDGGVAREVAKHPQVGNIVQVEIDGKVVEASKLHLPFMAGGFAAPQLSLHIGDGFQYMKDHKTEFDVIITDSSDPVGPAASLFTESYFELLKGALKPGGIICSQGGTVWADLGHVKDTLQHCRKHFKVVKYATASVPTYPTGQIGFVIAALESETDVTKPQYKFTEQEIEQKALRYYNEDIHRASFVLPNFARKVLF